MYSGLFRNGIGTRKLSTPDGIVNELCGVLPAPLTNLSPLKNAI